jgi:SAM-dependent methyltransferase
LPHGPLPKWPTDSGVNPAAALRAHFVPGSRVLLLGARYAPSYPAEPHSFAVMFPNTRIWGVDIHPGPGVNVVADAHQLASTFLRGSIDVVMSSSVFEHLAAPWVVAAEINRVLRMGGVVYHNAPYAWPAHSEPNDFWRFSADGLRQLFGPATGFEILSAVNSHHLCLIPDRSWRAEHLPMPVVPAFASCTIAARKIRELDDGAVAWPVNNADSASRAREYPLDAIAKRDSTSFTNAKVQIS